jgi:nitroreductase
VFITRVPSSYIITPQTFLIAPTRIHRFNTELIDAIKGRRSIREFKSDPVPRGIIEDIIEAGNWAPSVKNGHQWRFTVLTGKAKDDYNKKFRDALNGFIQKHGRKEAGSAPWTLEIMEEVPVLLIVWNINEYKWPSEEQSVAAARGTHEA